MLLTLSAQALRPVGPGSNKPFVGRISERDHGPSGSDILLVRRPCDPLPLGFRAYLVPADLPADLPAPPPDTYVLGPQFDYLSHGDVVRLDPKHRAIRVLYRRTSNHNSLLVTERCDNFCVMCSQPPKAGDDSWLVEELFDVIPLISPDTAVLGITGGEPALLGERLVQLIALMKSHLPRTAVHLLSNGRRFSDDTLTRSLAELQHPDLMIGIPLYSDLPEEHDYVVQARGAFDETIRGILHLKQRGMRVELRFVIHSETFARLPAFAAFVTRNLLFVDHVALMGLEPTGFAKTNLDALWIDPVDYAPGLLRAARTLSRANIRCSIYNHPLCVLPSELRPFARKSISDWKNTFLNECDACRRQNECAGFFASSRRRSVGITPFV
ncbi:MAG: His-Xaa-Ser system radical SAM maturase HxsC [Polyangiaceae bacterium]|jgi:His-Xaa-Ser system radical SAM maturase HxsC